MQLLSHGYFQRFQFESKRIVKDSQKPDLSWNNLKLQQKLVFHALLLRILLCIWNLRYVRSFQNKQNLSTKENFFAIFKLFGSQLLRTRKQIIKMHRPNKIEPREVVVAQLVERSLPTPEVRGSNPVIGKIYLYYQLY